MIQIAEAIDGCTSSGAYVARYGVLDVSLTHSGSYFTFTQTSGGHTEVTVFNDSDEYHPSTQAVTFEKF